MPHRTHRIRAEYGALAARYEKRWQRYLSVTHERTLRALGPLASGARVLDAGCGTGQMLRTLHARRPDLALIGLDASPLMLEQTGDADVARLQGELTHLPLTSATVNAVLCSSALHYVDDPALALAEMRRVLSGDGWLVLTDWRAEHAVTALRCMRLRFLRRPLGHVLRTGEALELMRRAGFSPERVERYSVRGWGLFTVLAAAA